jgi:hypothetical protein
VGHDSSPKKQICEVWKELRWYIHCRYIHCRYTCNFLVLQISAGCWKVKNSCLLRWESPASHRNAFCGFVVYRSACGEVCWEPLAPFQNHVVILYHDDLLNIMIKHAPIYTSSRHSILNQLWMYHFLRSLTQVSKSATANGWIIISSLDIVSRW